MMVDEPVDIEQNEEGMELTQTWTDIDELDHLDPQAVTPYVEEIYQNCRQKEVRVSRKQAFLTFLVVPPTAALTLKKKNPD